MTRELSPSLAALSRQLRVPDGYAWLAEVEIPPAVDGDPPSRLRVNSTSAPVPFGINSEGDDVIYSPAPFTLTPIEENTDGDQPILTATFACPPDNVIAFFEEHDGLDGASADIHLVNLSLLDADSGIHFGFRVYDSSLEERGLSVRLSAGALRLEQTPPTRYSRTNCSAKRVPYGGTLCGYDLNNPTIAAAHPTCTRLLEGPGGCRAHGDAEVAAGLERKHPLRFGGRRSIPRQRKA